MNQQRLTQVILAPIVSEKSNVLAEKRNQMTFKVLANATKPEIKAAVELLFGVQVADVTTVTIKGNEVIVRIPEGYSVVVETV